MKFGKTYMETMADPAFPAEWRSGALEYKHLKKLINGVVAELESLGLGADVLRELLVRPEDLQASASAGSLKPQHVQSSGHEGDDSNDNDDENAIADDSGNSSDQEDDQRSVKSDKLTPAGRWLSDFSVDVIRRASASNGPSGITLANEDAASAVGTASETSHVRSQLLGVPFADKPRSQSQGESSIEARLDATHLGQAGDRRGRNSIALGAIPAAGAKWAAIGRKDLDAMRRGKSVSNDVDPSRLGRSNEPSPGRHDWGANRWREAAKLEWEPGSNLLHPRSKSLSAAKALNFGTGGGGEAKRAASPAKDNARWVEGKSGRRARAEYELGGTPEHPVPRIRLFIESPLPSDDEDDGNDDEAIRSDNDSRKSIEEKIVQLPDTPTRSRSSSIPEDGPEGETREEKAARQGEIRKQHGIRSRQIVIPLTADTQFLDTLTNALQNLSNIQSNQREHFVTETESLCSSIARASSPYASKSDLYVWREIFSLWVDMQVFESQREKDRGELSIDESEARLKRFAQELAKRGWIHDPDAPAASTNKKRGRLVKLKIGSGSSSQGLQSQQSATAIEDFLRLNFALLDVKKFQRVNVEAARKILKKHDKRTALTASDDLRTFMAQQEAARRAMGINPVGSGGVINIPASALGLSDSTDSGSTGSMSNALVSTATHPTLAALLPSSTTGILSESLPHILLSLVTTTLLPILPSVDDYSCAICTSVAWRPVRLDCSHLFCLRCLVKLQKQGKADCPLCRAPDAVKTADKDNMDEEADKYLQLWFPKEVKEKTKENEKDRRQEELEALGLKEEKCIVM
ncbi:hypothetical protein BCV70DRAFT_190265 [Testicularia cyperi]|uniref:RING-type domain-containing protein n=1 Tax=Testicularia cyperi TaxID=1882483 RepID=A0A317XQW4_9BASI|nr:hypothetical protein BCV70DRAFT_190265 [Testicularia cyperi]